MNHLTWYIITLTLSIASMNQSQSIQKNIRRLIKSFNFSSFARSACLWILALSPSSLVSCALVFALWATVRPYTGIHHDGILYFAQAMQNRMPEVFEHDLFFAYGSQAKFTVFPALIASAWAQFGLTETNAVVTLLSQAAMMAAGFMLLKGASKSERWLALVAFAVLSHRYGGLGSFGFGEKFVTARTIAEPLCLFALLFFLQKKRVIGFAFLAIAFAIHPLIALPASLVVGLFLAHEDRRWWLAACAGLAAVTALALAGVAPFSGMLQAFDAQWLAGLQNSLPCFILDWEIEDWCLCAVSSLILHLAAKSLVRAMPGVAQLCRATLLLNLALLALSLIAADLLHNVLIMQLQIWRILWLSQCFAVLLMPMLVIRLFCGEASPPGDKVEVKVDHSSQRQFQIDAVAALSLLSATIAAGAMLKMGIVVVIWSAPWVLASSGVKNRTVHAWFNGARNGYLAWTVRMMFACLLVISAKSFFISYNVESSKGRSLSIDFICQTLASTPLVAFGFVFAAWWLFSQPRAVSKAMVGVFALLVAVFSASRWDQRSDWIKYVESSNGAAHPFSRHMAQGDQVYWDNNFLGTWLLLKHPSYFSIAQGAGSMFNRGTAVEFARRAPPFASLEFQAGICSIMDSFNGKDKTSGRQCKPSMEFVKDMCDLSNGPKFLIFPYAMQEGVIDQWTFNSSISVRGVEALSTTYYLHDCKKIAPSIN